MKRRLLCIDGGGIKGLYAATVLAEFEKKVNSPLYKYFDLIAGTSTGAIIGAGIATDISASKICEFYEKYADKIFPQNNKIQRMFHWVLSSKYQDKNLKLALSEMFENKTIGDCKTRLLIPAYNATTGKVQVFKTPHDKGLVTDYERSILDVLLSTTAAPTYLPPHKTTSGYYIDGGVGANNPSLIALVEAISKRCNWDINDIYLLSIGCMESSSSQIATNSKSLGIKNLHSILSMYMCAESQYSDNIAKILLKSDHYIRVDAFDSSNRASIDGSSKETLEYLKVMGINSAQQSVGAVYDLFLHSETEEYTPCVKSKVQPTNQKERIR